MLPRVLVAALLVHLTLGSGTAPAADPQLTVLPTHYRAIAVKIDPSDEKADFILPGSRVDAIQTRKLDSGKIESTVVLKNLLVVAIDVQVEPKKPNEIRARVVTLAVHSDAAAKFAATVKEGAISLIICKPDEEPKAKKQQPPQ